ncbi:MAG: cyclase family protein [Proteobacteria bacterium]|nr:cyclase family protein [Pseudomonadota bacterium]
MTAAAELLANLSTSIQGGAIKVVDLTQTLTPTTPVIALPPEVGANSPPFSMIPVSNFDEKGPGWAWNEIRMGEHTGTHFDAPNHWHTGRTYPDGGPATIPADQLIAPACVIDCSDESAENPDFLMEVEHIKAWEEKHGKIPAKSWVLMRTDWSKRTDPDAFLNGGHTPGPSIEAAKFLAEERDVMGFGVETVGTDAGMAGMFDPPFPAHHFMHGNNRYGLASLTNLDKLPPKGAVIITPPLKIAGGSGSPLRVLALVAG